MINCPVALMSSGTVAAIDSTAPGTAAGVVVDELSATLAARASPRPPDPPRHCHTPNVPTAATNTTTPATASHRGDNRRFAAGARRAECRPLPVTRTGTFSARRAASPNSPAVW